MNLILASSPRRRDFCSLNLPFQVIPALIEEQKPLKRLRRRR